jgi:hypothetical protein
MVYICDVDMEAGLTPNRSRPLPQLERPAPVGLPVDNWSYPECFRHENLIPLTHAPVLSALNARYRVARKQGAACKLVVQKLDTLKEVFRGVSEPVKIGQIPQNGMGVFRKRWLGVVSGAVFALMRRQQATTLQSDSWPADE